MTSFDSVISTWTILTNAIIGELEGVKCVDSISVPQPTPPEDELYFYKLVNWSYIALIEASPVVLKQLANLLRANDSTSFAQLNKTKTLIVALRTLQNHNSTENSSSDEHKKTTVEAWKLSNEKISGAWENLCSALCAELIEIFSSLKKVWDLVINNTTDSIGFISTLKHAVQSELPAHIFDDDVAQIATEIGLIDFNVVAYRKTRIEDWRKFSAFFDTREALVGAIRRAIYKELILLFGETRHN